MNLSDLTPVELPLQVNDKAITPENYQTESYETISLSHGFEIVLWLEEIGIIEPLRETYAFFWEALLNGPDGPIGPEGLLPEIDFKNPNFGPFETREKAIEHVLAIARSYQSDVEILVELDEKKSSSFARMDLHIEASIFKAIVTEVVGSKLTELGYEANLQPPQDEDGFVWFEKTLQEGVYIVIEFQPRGLAPEKFIDFAVNLTRNYYSVYQGQQIVPRYCLSERLAPWLWVENRSDTEWKADHWWHFLNESELRLACNDALDKLLKYGLPYLEDLNSKSWKLSA
jgi:hypothetical protein